MADVDPVVEYESEEDVGQLDDAELQRRFAAGELTGGGSTAYFKPRSSVVPRMIQPMDVAGLEACTKEIGILDKMNWAETFLVTSKLEDDVDAEDDLTRENLFYDHTLSCVEDAVRKLRKAKVPIMRPDDYYAEMLKTDDHMRKVREKILVESQKIDASERARKQRHNKKFGKEMQKKYPAQAHGREAGGHQFGIKAARRAQAENVQRRRCLRHRG